MLAPFTYAQKYAAIVVDAQTGEVLHETDPDGYRYPASLTKMMTLYLLFEALDAKKIKLSTQFRVPKEATYVEPSKLYLRTGQTISVRDLILALITKSANDASVTVATGLAPTIKAFAQKMNEKARCLGMTRTHFQNPHGLPDTRQLSTARDMTRLAHALITRFPHYYHLFKTPAFYYKGHAHANHNHLLKSFQGLDGVKTGYFKKAGSNLAASAVRNSHGSPRRLIAVVLGCSSRFARDKIVASLLDEGFKTARTCKSRSRITWTVHKASSPTTYKHAVYHRDPHQLKTSQPDPMGDLIQNKILNATPVVAKARVKTMKPQHKQPLKKKNTVKPLQAHTHIKKTMLPVQRKITSPKKYMTLQQRIQRRRHPKPLKAA